MLGVLGLVGDMRISLTPDERYYLARLIYQVIPRKNSWCQK